MKNYSRAYNRHKKEVKFLRRVNNWFAGWDGPEKQKVLKGENHTFLKTTGRPCNCDGCTYLKYKRPSKHKILKEENEK